MVAGLLLAAATPAAAQGTPGPWRMAASDCTLSYAVNDPEETEVAFSPNALSDEINVDIGSTRALLGDRWYRKLGGAGAAAAVWTQDGRSHIYARLDGEGFARTLAAGSIRVSNVPKGQEFEIPLPGAPVPPEFATCAGAAARDGRGSGEPAVTPPQRRGTPDWFTTDDYPGWARRDQIGGPMRMRVTIASNGRVAGCKVTQSVGDAWLDAYTCDILRRRGRFLPARDAQGRPTLGTYDYDHLWVPLPPYPPPPAIRRP